MKRKIVAVPVLIFILCALAAILPLPWNENAENFFLDLNYNLRGGRDLSAKFALVFISQEDIEALGGWPITRDYYGYVAHLLHQRGAKVIGFDLLFAAEDKHHPEFDGMLTHFFQFTGNVCLPMLFQEWEWDGDGRHDHGQHPLYPIPSILSSLAGSGFSNLSADVFQRHAPLFTQYRDSLVLSFGAELARVFLAGKNSQRTLLDHEIEIENPEGQVFRFPFQRNDGLYLNHFGDASRVRAISLVDLIQRFKSQPDSLDFSNTLVLVTVTAPGRAVLKTTPLTSALPAALIHLTLAENLIEQNYLTRLSGWWHGLWVAFAVFPLCWIGRQPKRLRLIGESVGWLGIYWLLTYFAFAGLNLIVPVFYPLAAGFLTLVFLLATHLRQHEIETQTLQEQLHAEIQKQNHELSIARNALVAFGDKHQQEMAENKVWSHEARNQLNEQKMKVIELEKKLRDLEAVQTPAVSPRIGEADSEIRFSPDSKMVQIMALIDKVAPDEIPVLITGETGTGKEMIARTIHRKSRRQKGPFVAVNCGALPETLLESELFGHEKGSFTGAQGRRRGRFELADGGTLFLDEITETSPAFQVRLLRALQEGTIERLGSEQTLQINVRIIAASNQDLHQAVARGEFRPDLFYRLNGFPIHLPPLRERTADIPLLAATFLKKHGYHSIENFSGRAMDALKNYRWPGNVRELENLVRRAALLAQSEQRPLIQMQDLPPEIEDTRPDWNRESIHKPLETQILEMLRTFHFAHNAISRTAKALGNRDRGTITEYFRGICFENLVRARFDVLSAAKEIVGEADTAVIEKVAAKIMSYIENLRPLIDPIAPAQLTEAEIQSRFKGLPKKYSAVVRQVIDYFRQNPPDPPV